jgi:hypothetical protein
MASRTGMEREPDTGIAVRPYPAELRDSVRRRVNPCRCAPKHFPMYYKTHSFFIQPGESYWLCPTTLENLRWLLKEYALVGGEPSREVQAYFSRYVRHLANRSWYIDKVTRKHVKLSVGRPKKKVN